MQFRREAYTTKKHTREVDIYVSSRGVWDLKGYPNQTIQTYMNYF